MIEGKVDDDLLKKFDDLAKDLPSEVVSQIYAYENMHAQLILKSFGRYVSQFEAYFDLLVKIVHGVNYIEKSDWPEHRSVQLTILVNNIKPIFSAFDRSLKGYYEDSLTLSRTVYEAFIKIVYISCYPDRPFAAVHKQKDGGREFNLTNFLKDDLGFSWGDYNVLSSMAHANQYSVLESIISRFKSSEPKLVTMEYKYDNKMFQLCMNYTMFLQLVILKLLVTLFTTSSNQTLTKEMIIKAKDLIEMRETAFRSTPDSKWPEMMDDTKDLFTLIERCEKGETFKDAWSKIKSR